MDNDTYQTRLILAKFDHTHHVWIVDMNGVYDLKKKNLFYEHSGMKRKMKSQSQKMCLEKLTKLSQQTKS